MMMNCWAEKPDKRPPFETLRQDLDDFEIIMEDKYANYVEGLGFQTTDQEYTPRDNIPTRCHEK